MEKDLGAEINRVEKDLRSDINRVEKDLRADINRLEKDLRTEIKGESSLLRHEIEVLRRDLTIRLGGMMIAGFGLLLGAMRYMLVHG